jgi:hypothetical protein
MRVLVTGSTTWTSQDALRVRLAALPAGSTIVTGDTQGVDALSALVARQLGLKVELMKKSAEDRLACPGAAWKGLNARMLATGIDLVLGFHADYGQPGCARGTVHMVELATAAGVKTQVFRA